MNVNYPSKEFLRIVRLIAIWVFILATSCLFVIANVDVHAQTAPCSALKSCVVERSAVKTRNALESDGLKSDPAESLVDRGEERRYWLRCWQKGVLITERITKTPPPESIKIVAATSAEENAVKVFDLKNATCLVETLPGER
jgi:hypothetical protein